MSRTVPIELMLATVAFAEHNGLDTHQLLEAAGVSPELLAEGRSRVTEDQVTRFVQELWRHTDDELFGLGSHPLPRGSFRLLCYGLIGAPDLGGFLVRLQELVRAIPAFPQVTAASDGDLERVVIESRLHPALDDAMTDELLGSLVVCAGLAVVHRMLAWAVGGRLPLTAIELPYPPRHEESHELVFGVPLVFDAGAPALVFSASLVRTPIVRTEAQLDEFIAQSPAGLLSRPKQESTVAEQVQRILGHSLRAAGSRKLPAGDDIAARLAISPQTLRRRLAAEGTSLREVRDDLLRDEAVTALVQGDETVAEIAARLGFSEASAFTRAFGRWTGGSPNLYRRGINPEA